MAGELGGRNLRLSEFAVPSLLQTAVMEGRRRTVGRNLVHFLHLSTLHRLHPALFFSGCCSAFHAVVLFAEMPSFYCMLD
jgi:hypothetical protein